MSEFIQLEQDANTETMWFIRDKQSPEGFNRLLCENRTRKYRAFPSEADCVAYLASMSDSEGYEPVELEIED